MELKLDKIYIIHYIKLKERRDYLEKRLKELGLEKYVEWVVSEKEGSFPKSYYKLHDRSEEALDERRKYLEKFPHVGKIDIIMTLQHIQILNKISKSKKNSVSIVFEDDVLLDKEFNSRLKSTLDKLDKLEWDICYSDKGSLLVEPKVNNSKGEVSIYKPSGRKSNTTGSYIITPEGAKNLIKLMKSVALGPDLELTYTQRKNKLKVYWTVPFLTNQGSIEEIYSSNVRTGSLVGKVIKTTNKIKKISPTLAKLVLRVSDFGINMAYKSKLLLYFKDKIKKSMDLKIN